MPREGRDAAIAPDLELVRDDVGRRSVLVKSKSWGEVPVRAALDRRRPAGIGEPVVLCVTRLGRVLCAHGSAKRKKAEMVQKKLTPEQQ